MMKNFKKIALSVLGVAVLTVGFIGCSGDDATTKNEEKVEVNGVKSNSVERFHYSDFEFVGVEHNAILGGVLEDVIKDDNIKNEDLGIAMSNYIFEKSSKLINSDKEVEYSKNIIDEMIYNPIDVSENLYSGRNIELVSEYCKGILDDLHSTLFSDNEIELIVKNIESIEESAYKNSNLTNSDLYVIFTATSVAKNTIVYWNENYNKWNEALNKREISLHSLLGVKKKSPGRHIAEIGAADVGGAVGGALTAWVVNVVPGWGQVAYGGAIVGGAIGASATAAVVKMADAIFDSYEATRNYR